jgi:hypothetical protein
LAEVKAFCTILKKKRKIPMPLIAPVFNGKMLLVSAIALFLTCSTTGVAGFAHAEPYQSRLNSLLLRKNDVYLPNRLTLGQEARFIVKATPGSLVKLFVSAQGEGKILPNDVALRVGDDAQELSGIVPENGVLELKMDVPRDPDLEGRIVYVDAVAGTSEENLKPINLVDSTGRRTDENALPMMAQVVGGSGPSVMPAMPGVSPQVFNQLTTMGNIYSQGDKEKKDLLDNGDINRDRNIDRNPFINRGLQQGVGGR